MNDNSSSIFKHLYGGLERFAKGFHSHDLLISQFGFPVAANRVNKLVCKLICLNEKCCYV